MCQRPQSIKSLGKMAANQDSEDLGLPPRPREIPEKEGFALTQIAALEALDLTIGHIESCIEIWRCITQNNPSLVHWIIGRNFMHGAPVVIVNLQEYVDYFRRFAPPIDLPIIRCILEAREIGEDVQATARRKNILLPVGLNFTKRHLRWLTGGPSSSATSQTSISYYICQILNKAISSPFTAEELDVLSPLGIYGNGFFNFEGMYYPQDSLTVAQIRILKELIDNTIYEGPHIKTFLTSFPEYKIVKIPPNGHCFYTSIGRQTGENQAQVRQRLHGWLTLFWQIHGAINRFNGFEFNEIPRMIQEQRILNPGDSREFDYWGSITLCPFVALCYQRPVVAIAQAMRIIYPASTEGTELAYDLEANIAMFRGLPNPIILIHNGDHWFTVRRT